MVHVAHHGVLQGVRKWPVADVVQQDRNTGRLLFFGCNFVTFASQDGNGALHQMHGAECVMKANMVRAGIDQVGQAQLGNPPKALKIRVFNELKYQRALHGNESVYGIVEYLVSVTEVGFECHGHEFVGCKVFT